MTMTEITTPLRDLTQVMLTNPEKAADLALEFALDALRKGAASLPPESVRTIGYSVERLESIMTLSSLHQSGLIFGDEAYQSSGIKLRGDLPPIPDAVVRNCKEAPVGSMIIYYPGMNIDELEKIANDARLKISVGCHARYAIKSQEEQGGASPAGWYVLPMSSVSNRNGIWFTSSPDEAAAQANRGFSNFKLSVPDPKILALGLVLYRCMRQEALFVNDLVFTDVKGVVVGTESRDGPIVIKEISDWPNRSSPYRFRVAPLGTLGERPRPVIHHTTNDSGERFVKHVYP